MIGFCQLSVDTCVQDKMICLLNSLCSRTPGPVSTKRCTEHPFIDQIKGARFFWERTKIQ